MQGVYSGVFLGSTPVEPGLESRVGQREKMGSRVAPPKVSTDPVGSSKSDGPSDLSSIRAPITYYL